MLWPAKPAAPQSVHFSQISFSLSGQSQTDTVIIRNKKKKKAEKGLQCPGGSGYAVLITLMQQSFAELPSGLQLLSLPSNNYSFGRSLEIIVFPPSPKITETSNIAYALLGII